MQFNRYKIIFIASILTLLTVEAYCFWDTRSFDLAEEPSYKESLLEAVEIKAPRNRVAWKKTGGNLFAEPFIEKAVPELEIVTTEPQPYRIQLTGWSEQGSDTLLMLSCKDYPQALIGKQGDTFSEQGFTIISFKKVSQNKHGAKSQTPRVTIADHFLNKEIHLTNEPCVL